MVICNNLSASPLFFFTAFVKNKPSSGQWQKQNCHSRVNTISRCEMSISNIQNNKKILYKILTSTWQSWDIETQIPRNMKLYLNQKMHIK